MLGHLSFWRQEDPAVAGRVETSSWFFFQWKGNENRACSFSSTGWWWVAILLHPVLPPFCVLHSPNPLLFKSSQSLVVCSISLCLQPPFMLLVLPAHFTFSLSSPHLALTSSLLKTVASSQLTSAPSELLVFPGLAVPGYICPAQQTQYYFSSLVAHKHPHFTAVT